MGISDKDQKILWARAAGRCSMEDCRMALTLDPQGAAAATVGEMAHIVGKGKGSARSESLLTEDERDSYANLVLMCPTHHTLIDTDEERYPVEILHQIKTTHELWVTESLSGPEVEPDDLVYADLIDTIVTAMRLERWSFLVEPALRDLVHEDYVDARGVLNYKLVGAIWPEKYPDLTDALRGVLSSYNQFITHYLTRAEHRENDRFYRPDKSYARVGINRKYDRYAARLNIWSRKNFWLLADLSVRLNEFAARVRAHVNPLFFRVQGEFLIVDDLGTNFDGKPTIFRPTRESVNQQLAEIAAEEQADPFDDLREPE
jgi:hypothetical protein